MKKTNKVADILKIFALIIAICGGLGGIVIGLSVEDFVIFLAILVGVAISAFAIYAFAEIIQLLHDIKLNTSGYGVSEHGVSPVAEKNVMQDIEDNLPEL